MTSHGLINEDSLSSSQILINKALMLTNLTLDKGLITVLIV